MPLPLPRNFLDKPKQNDKKAHLARYNQEKVYKNLLFGTQLP